MAPGGVFPPLRYGPTCPLVGVADASEPSPPTLASLGHRSRLTLVACAPQALTAELTLLALQRPTGALQGAPDDAAPTLRAARAPPNEPAQTAFGAITPTANHFVNASPNHFRTCRSGGGRVTA